MFKQKIGWIGWTLNRNTRININSNINIKMWNRWRFNWMVRVGPPLLHDVFGIKHIEREILGHFDHFSPTSCATLVASILRAPSVLKIYDLKRSADLRWLFDPVLHSSLDDLVWQLSIINPTLLSTSTCMSASRSGKSLADPHKRFTRFECGGVSSQVESQRKS